MMISRTLSVCLAAAGFAFLIGASAPASAAPGIVAVSRANAALVQEAGYYKRRWRYNNGTYVRAPFTEVDTRRGTWVSAPFARVYSGPNGTWVRAPFVNLWAPR
jgi:hypothetical protein